MVRSLLFRASWLAVVFTGSVCAVASCSGSTASDLSGPAGSDAGTYDAEGSDGNASSDGDLEADSGADAGTCAPRPSPGNTCPKEECYCADTASCFAASIATACCAQPVSCTTKDAGSLDASDCKGSHPLLDASVRYCSPKHCYCATRDVCLAEQIAASCCADAVVICY